jgi:hypothetical protein
MKGGAIHTNSEMLPCEQNALFLFCMLLGGIILLKAREHANTTFEVCQSTHSVFER